MDQLLTWGRLFNMQGEFEESMVRTLWCFDACASRANGQDVDEKAAWWGVEFAVIDV